MHDGRLNQLRSSYPTDDYFGDEPPDLGPLQALSEREEVAEAVSRLADSFGRPLPADDPLGPLARDIARALTEAGFTLHHCVQHHPLYRLGGVCLLPVARGHDPDGRGEGSGVLDDARSAVPGLGPGQRVSRGARCHERRARPSARCARVPGVALRPRWRVDRHRPPTWLGRDGAVSTAAEVRAAVVRRDLWSGKQFQRCHVSWGHSTEVALVESGHLASPEPFGGRYYRCIGDAQGEAPVLAH